MLFQDKFAMLLGHFGTQSSNRKNEVEEQWPAAMVEESLRQEDSDNENE